MIPQLARPTDPEVIAVGFKLFKLSDCIAVGTSRPVDWSIAYIRKVIIFSTTIQTQYYYE